MSETLEQVKEEAVIAPNPWAQEKTEPTLVTPVEDPVIKEKEEKIKEDNPEVVKPGEPEKIPGATPAPIQDRPDETKTGFANEESEKVFNLLREGKTEDLIALLSEQSKLKNADKLDPADVIKLDLQYKNKDYLPDDINDLFEEKYGMPEKPVETEYESDEDFAERLVKYNKEVQKIENRIKRDSKPAAAELAKLAKDIVLPDITKAQSPSPEPTQEELDAQKIQSEAFLKTVDEGLEKFNGYNATYKDKEVEIQVGYVLTAEEKKELQPIIALAGTDAGAFLQKVGWLDDKGNINTAKLTEDLPLLLSREKVINRLVSETGNKRHEASIKSIKNIDYSGSKSSSGDLGATPQQKEESMVRHFFNS